MAVGPEKCRELGHRVILNPAPSREIPQGAYHHLFLITPNEKEAEVLTGIRVSDLTSTEKAAERLAVQGIQNIVITLGAKGAYLHSKDHKILIPAPEISAVDSTGAGDCFNGALAVALSENLKLDEAVSFAVQAAAISVTRMGAQASMPFRSEIISHQATKAQRNH